MVKKPMTFGEYLAQLMNIKRISVTDLTRRMNYRSKTSIARILKDEVRYSSIEDFMNRLEPMEDWLLSAEEKQNLRQAMEVTRLGLARYQAYRDIWRLVKKPCPCPREVRLEGFGAVCAQNLNELAEKWHQAVRVNMTIINSGYRSLFREIRRFLDANPERDVDIRHYLAVDDAAGSMAEQLAAVSQVFRDRRYHGFYRSGYNGRSTNQNVINDFVVVRAVMADGSSFMQVVYMLAEDRALAYESVSEEGFGELFRRLYHVTPGRFVTHLRICAAEDMLRMKSYTVAEIAEAVGYASPGYFCRVFTRETGCAPSRWLDREQMR